MYTNLLNKPFITLLYVSCPHLTFIRTNVWVSEGINACLLESIAQMLE